MRRGLRQSAGRLGVSYLDLPSGAPLHSVIQLPFDYLDVISGQGGLDLVLAIRFG